MVWSKHDFEREVRRQMVELESIRKRCPGNPDVHRRIDLLEESHRNVLRKLGDVFNSSEWSKEHSAKHQRASAHASSGAELDPRVLEKYLRSSDQASLRLKSILGVETTTRSLRAAPLRRRKETEPCFETKCGTCGETLFSGPRDPEGAVFDGTCWHHRRCPGEGELSGPGLLN